MGINFIGIEVTTIYDLDNKEINFNPHVIYWINEDVISHLTSHTLTCKDGRIYKLTPESKTYLHNLFNLI